MGADAPSASPGPLPAGSAGCSASRVDDAERGWAADGGPPGIRRASPRAGLGGEGKGAGRAAPRCQAGCQRGMDSFWLLLLGNRRGAPKGPGCSSSDGGQPSADTTPVSDCGWGSPPSPSLSEESSSRKSVQKKMKELQNVFSSLPVQKPHRESMMNCKLFYIEFNFQQKEGPRSNQARTFPGSKNDKTKAVVLQTHHEKARLI